MKKVGIAVGAVLVGFGAVLYAQNKKTREIASVEEAQPATMALQMHQEKSDSKQAVHEFRQKESLWFIASVYYGKGSEYTKIVEANKLPSTEGLKEGQKLVIPNPKWSKETAGFKDRYQSLWNEREKALAHKDKQASANDHDAEAHPAQHKSTEFVDAASPSLKVASSHEKAKAVVNNGDSSEVMIVPIPASPIFRADGSEDSTLHSRTANEAQGH